jgi:hypothetical protein
VTRQKNLIKDVHNESPEWKSTAELKTESRKTDYEAAEWSDESNVGYCVFYLSGEGKRGTERRR